MDIRASKTLVYTSRDGVLLVLPPIYQNSLTAHTASITNRVDRAILMSTSSVFISQT